MLRSIYSEQYIQKYGNNLCGCAFSLQMVEAYGQSYIDRMGKIAEKTEKMMDLRG